MLSRATAFLALWQLRTKTLPRRGLPARLVWHALRRLVVLVQGCVWHVAPVRNIRRWRSTPAQRPDQTTCAAQGDAGHALRPAPTLPTQWRRHRGKCHAPLGLRAPRFAKSGSIPGHALVQRHMIILAVNRATILAMKRIVAVPATASSRLAIATDTSTASSASSTIV